MDFEGWGMRVTGMLGEYATQKNTARVFANRRRPPARPERAVWLQRPRSSRATAGGGYSLSAATIVVRRA